MSGLIHGCPPPPQRSYCCTSRLQRVGVKKKKLLKEKKEQGALSYTNISFNDWAASLGLVTNCRRSRKNCCPKPIKKLMGRKMTPLLLPPSLLKEGQRARVQEERKKEGKLQGPLGQNLEHHMKLGVHQFHRMIITSQRGGRQPWRPLFPAQTLVSNVCLHQHWKHPVQLTCVSFCYSVCVCVRVNFLSPSL